MQKKIILAEIFVQKNTINEHTFILSISYNLARKSDPFTLYSFINKNENSLHVIKTTSIEFIS